MKAATMPTTIVSQIGMFCLPGRRQATQESDDGADDDGLDDVDEHVRSPGG
jgi:hypothetical protein